MLVVRDEYSAPLVAAGFGPDGAPDARAFSPSDVAGRRPLGLVQVGDEALLLRFHQHGGLLRCLTGDRFLQAERPFEELLLAERLRAKGIPTPRVVAARMQRTAFCFWRLALVSVRQPKTLDVARALLQTAHAQAARSLVRAMGEFVGRLHQAGLLHVDLHPGNMLVQADWAMAPEPEFWILDLDRCGLVEPLEEPQRLGMLARLARYALRRPELASRALTRSNALRFLKAYAELRSPAGQPAEWKADWRAVAQRLSSADRRHRMGWCLEELLGAGADTRQG